jgi:carbonic anhydrase-like protein
MPINPAYESTLPWDARRPDTLVISCVDGRWYPHIVEFARRQLAAGSGIDFLAVPGGIEPLMLFDLVPKDFSFLRRRLEGLVAAHGTRRIVAIAHQDCAWYRMRKIGPIVADLRERQISDLRGARARIRDMFDDITVETYFARLDAAAPQHVVFDVV